MSPPDATRYVVVSTMAVATSSWRKLNPTDVMERKRRSYLLMCIALAMVAMAGVACPPQDEPFPFQYQGTPAATPSPIPDATPEKVITHKYDVITSGETIRIAEWDDNTLKLLNFLAGYVIVFGLDHAVEIVELANEDYGDALLSGDVHIVLQMEQSWQETIGGAAGILDIGGPFESRPNVRIGASPSLNDASPEIVEFLTNFVLEEEQIDDLAARITGGRIGMRPNVAGVKYFKEQEDVWTRWIDEETAELVREAIASNKTGLVNRKCIPDGGNDNCVR